ncbi:MAG: N-acetylmuramoyl-L-alanine amidase, partial [Chloroflexota bacterium]
TSTATDQAIDGQVALAESEVQESPLKRLLDNQNDSSVSSRGGQRSIQPSHPVNEYADLPTPSSTTAVQPTPTASPVLAPTATALPPTPVTTNTPTASPASPAEPVARVGIQVGHWKNSELPAELASLRGSTGAAGQGWREVDVNLDISQRAAAILKANNVIVDLIPATVPIRYKADAFVAVHGDANSNTAISGYKLARASWSRIPAKDDALLNAISSEYASATGLRYHAGTITRAMTAYYAFNQQIQHAVDPSTPAVILELGFLTTLSDRKLLMEQPDRAAEGLANGILKFLGMR